MRKKNILTPVIILSARGTVEDRVKGLQIGADDYLTKPFSISELIARIQALLRRASGMSGPTVLTAGDLTMNLETRVVTRNDVPVELKPKEFRPAGIFDVQQVPGRFEEDDYGSCLGLCGRNRG